MKQVKNFTEGPILFPLIRFALPVLAALFLQTMYGAIDLLVVGQFSDAANVSAVSTGSQFMQTLTVLMNGLAMGLTILIGQAMGRSQPQQAGKTAGNGICIFFILALAMTVGAIAGANPITQLLHAPQEAFSLTADYIRICSAGSIFIVAYNVLGSIFRGIGDSKMPLIAVSIACVCNILFDLLFVAVFQLGAAGAAFATVIAQAVSVILSSEIIRRRALPFSMTKKDLLMDRKTIKQIFTLGIPIALQDLLVNISFLVMMAIVNALGVIASAGVGVAEKLCGFIMLIPSAYMQSLSAFVAQNIGAGRPDRARKTLQYGISTSILAGVFMAYAAFFHSEQLAAIFANDHDVILAGADYLRAYAIDTLLTSFLFCYIGYFNGCGKTFFVMVQGIAGAFFIRIPLAYFISQISGATLFQIGLATPSSSIVQIALCVLYYKNKKQSSKS